MYSAQSYSARPYSAARRGLLADRRALYPGESYFAGHALTERIVEVDVVVDQVRAVAVSQVFQGPA